MASKQKRDLSKLSFEEILTRLEDVVEQLAAGDAPLEEALATFEQGVALSRHGAARLSQRHCLQPSPRAVGHLLGCGAQGPQPVVGASAPDRLLCVELLSQLRYLRAHNGERRLRLGQLGAQRSVVAEELPLALLRL